jgi:hypothetical protein
MRIQINLAKLTKKFAEIFVQFGVLVEKGLINHFAHFCPSKMVEIEANFYKDI